MGLSGDLKAGLLKQGHEFFAVVEPTHGRELLQLVMELPRGLAVPWGELRRQRQAPRSRRVVGVCQAPKLPLKTRPRVHARTVHGVVVRNKQLACVQVRGRDHEVHLQPRLACLWIGLVSVLHPQRLVGVQLEPRKQRIALERLPKLLLRVFAQLRILRCEAQHTAGVRPLVWGVSQQAQERGRFAIEHTRRVRALLSLGVPRTQQVAHRRTRTRRQPV